MPFSEEKAAKAVKFIEGRCRHTKGDFARRYKCEITTVLNFDKHLEILRGDRP